MVQHILKLVERIVETMSEGYTHTNLRSDNVLHFQDLLKLCYICTSHSSYRARALCQIQVYWLHQDVDSSLLVGHRDSPTPISTRPAECAAQWRVLHEVWDSTNDSTELLHQGSTCRRIPDDDKQHDRGWTRLKHRFPLRRNVCLSNPSAG